MVDFVDVADVNPTVSYIVGASPQSVFTVPFAFFDDGDLDVSVGGVAKVLSLDFTVAGAELPAGGTVTLLVPVSNTTVTIVRNMTIARTTHFPPSGPLQIPGLNKELSRLIAMMQEIARDTVPSAVIQQLLSDLADQLFEADPKTFPVFATTSSAGLANIDVAATFAICMGHNAAGDCGQILFFKKVATAPPHAGRFQSLNGLWFELINDEITLEMFAAVGDGVTDDHQAYINAWDYITRRGGGYIHLRSGHSYNIDVSSVPAASVLVSVTNCRGVGIIGHGGKILIPRVFTGTTTAYFTQFFNCDHIILQDFEVVASAEDPSEAASTRGIQIFWIRDGSRRCYARNLKVTGGRGFLWGSHVDPASTESPTEFFDVVDIQGDRCFYLLVFSYGTRFVNVRNVSNVKGGRTMFIKNTTMLRAAVRSVDHYADDILIECLTQSGLASSGCEDIDITYSTSGRSVAAAAGAASTITMRTDGVGGAGALNIRYNFSIDGGGGGGFPVALTIIRQTATGGSEVGNPARGHRVASVIASGSLRNMPAGTIVALFASWPAGESITGCGFRDFTYSGATAAEIQVTTTPLSSHPFFLDNVTLVGGAFSTAGTPAGQINFTNFKDTANDWHSALRVAVAGAYVDCMISKPEAFTIRAYVRASLPGGLTNQWLAFVTNPESGKGGLVYWTGGQWRYVLDETPVSP